MLKQEVLELLQSAHTYTSDERNHVSLMSLNSIPTAMRVSGAWGGAFKHDKLFNDRFVYYYGLTQKISGDPKNHQECIRIRTDNTAAPVLNGSLNPDAMMRIIAITTNEFNDFNSARSISLEATDRNITIVSTTHNAAYMLRNAALDNNIDLDKQPEEFAPLFEELKGTLQRVLSEVEKANKQRTEERNARMERIERLEGRSI